MIIIIIMYVRCAGITWVFKKWRMILYLQYLLSIYICNFFNFEKSLSKIYEMLLVYTLELTQENGAISICRLLLGNAKNKFFKGKQYVCHILILFPAILMSWAYPTVKNKIEKKYNMVWMHHCFLVFTLPDMIS